MTTETETTEEETALALCACGCGEAVRKGSTFRPGHDARLKGRIRRGEADLTDPIVAEFAARHGLEAAPPKAPKPKAAPKRKARTRKPKAAAAA